MAFYCLVVSPYLLFALSDIYRNPFREGPTNMVSMVTDRSPESYWRMRKACGGEKAYHKLLKKALRPIPGMHPTDKVVKGCKYG